MKNIVLIGWWSGTSNLLRVFAQVPDWQVSAIITTSDSGGSTWVIRDAYGIPAIGDIVKNIAALAWGTSSWMLHRYQEWFLSGHTVGNLWLLGLMQIHGFTEGITKAHEILWIKRNKVIPVTDISHDIEVTTYDGQVISWESQIIQCQALSHNIASIKLIPAPPSSLGALEVIQNADIIIFWPGTLYTSLIVCLLPEGISHALQSSKAEKLYIANVANFPKGHCDGYTLSDYLEQIQGFTGISGFDRILAHDGTGIPEEQKVVVWDQKNLSVQNILSAPAEWLGGKFDSIPRNTYRHDAQKVLNWIVG